MIVFSWFMLDKRATQIGWPFFIKVIFYQAWVVVGK